MPDPLKYFRVEAREILEQLQSGLLELERGGVLPEAVQRLLRLAHTLKGAARVVKQPEIAGLAHGLEELLLPLRGLERPPSSAEMEALLGPVDAIAEQVAKLAPAPAPEGSGESARREAAPKPVKSAATKVGDDVGRSTAAPLEHVEELVDGVLELGYSLGGLRDGVPELSQAHRLSAQLGARLEAWRGGLEAADVIALRAMAGELEARLAQLERETRQGLERAQRELSQVRERVEQLRLVSVSSIFGRLDRTLRDAAVSLGKQAQLETRGGDVRLDAQVLTAVERALVQAVRNAVAHGIESAPERSRAGKPSAGRVVLEVERSGARIYFRCRDDGRGIDLGLVQREAERLGRVPRGASTPGAQELIGLLLEGGLSTSREVSEVSGRGVGMNLIRDALAGINGSVGLETQAGAGTSVVLSVPADVAALEGLLVEVAGDVQVLPLDAVVRVARVSTRELTRNADGTALSLDGQVLPFAELGRLLGRSARAGERSVGPVVVLRCRQGLLALGVERLRGAETVVARAVGDAAALEPSVAGVSLDAEGNPRLVLDPEGLAAALRRAPGAAEAPSLARRLILVIDDSLTTRMLEQSILESAGYDVELATSAEEGLELARARRHDLFLVDVEMPGMDGFAFVERVRADPQLRSTPAVLVTSRASKSDRERGLSVGASGHIAKGEFDQVSFLARVRELVG